MPAKKSPKINATKPKPTKAVPVVKGAKKSSKKSGKGC